MAEQDAKQKVLVGSVTRASGGHVSDSLREVEFRGEYLGEISRPDIGMHSTTRGDIERLYRLEDGRLMVHREFWTQWQGETSTQRIVIVREDDLESGGEFESLGLATGFGRPLSIDEALGRMAGATG